MSVSPCRAIGLGLEETKMRNLRSILATAFAFAVLVAPVSAAPTSTGDFVSGSGYRLSQNIVHFRVDAQSTSDGGASGSYLYRNLGVDLTFTGRVTCLDVAGNQAAVGGVITKLIANETSIEVGDAFLVFFIDNGNPYRGQDGPDVVSQTYVFPGSELDVEVPGDFPDTCPDAAATAHDAFGVRGNFVVKDNLDN